MSFLNLSETDRRRIYRTGWLIAVFAVCGYLLIAYSEQGSAGAGLQIVPNDPLPFERHTAVGIDLSGFTSLAALEWLEQVNTSGVPMILLPIDGDIVSAFNNPDTYMAARIAVDQLISAADGAEVTACLSRPIAAIDEAILAEAVVAALVESYTDRITYIGACTPQTSASWQTSVLDLLGYDPPSQAAASLIAPVSVGAALRLQDPAQIDEIDQEYLDEITGTSYAALRLTNGPSIDPATAAAISGILHDRAHVAAVLASPEPGVDPSAFVASLALNPGAYGELSEGFNNVSSPLIDWRGNWSSTAVGPVSYQRTNETGSWLTTEFIGTEIWAVGIVSPDGGRLGIWIDAESPEQTGSPDRIVDLTSSQARDASVVLMDGLPAARHSITIVAADGDVALSGIFVTGRPEAGWHGVLGALGMIVLAMAGVAVVLTSAVDDLRRRIGLDRNDDGSEDHPRMFRRDL